MNTPEQDMEDRAMSYSLDDEEVKAMEDGLGQDPLQVLLSDGDRILKRKELHEDIAEFQRNMDDEQEEMWACLTRMRRWKEHKDEAQKKLQELGAKP